MNPASLFRHDFRRQMHRTVVLNVVGLSSSLLDDRMPFLSRWSAEGRRAAIGGVLPAVTCSVQSTYLTGEWPSTHGVVGNGWYFRDECEVKFWRQSNRLVQAPKLWDLARDRDSSFTCANLFWWYNMYSTVDYAATPRPMYPSDGRKLPDVYTTPADLRDVLQKKLGQFPLFEFWGPNTTINSTKWIAGAARFVEEEHKPTLSLVYLPHLDYALQRHGSSPPLIAKDLGEVDDVVGQLIRFYERRKVKVIVLSEYGISDVKRPVSLNRMLRNCGLVAVREELGRELLDAGASEAFAVADHQIAHVYVRNPDRIEHVRKLVANTPGVERVLVGEERAEAHLDHDRAGEIIAIAEPDAWFTYYYWTDDERAPDYAPTVDIHRKPGYDPAELFINPDLKAPKLRAGFRLLQKKLGFRYLMDVIPLRGDMVRGSHGRIDVPDGEKPVFITRSGEMLPGGEVVPTAVRDLILGHVFGEVDAQDLADARSEGAARR